MESDYIYLEPLKKRTKLLAKDGKWTWDIHGNIVAIDESVERLLVYLAHVGNTGEWNFFQLLNANLPKKVALGFSPEYLKGTFKAYHPFEDAEFRREEVGLIADKETGMYVCGDGKKWSLWLTAGDERILLNRVKSGQTPWTSCKGYMETVASRYGLALSKEDIDHCANSFLMQHGFSPAMAKSREAGLVAAARLKQQKKGTAKPVKNPIKDGVTPTNGAVVFVGFLVMAALIFYWTLTFNGVDLGVFLFPFLSALIAIMVEANGVGNIRKFCAIQYMVLFAGNIITAILAIIFQWGYDVSWFSDSPDTGVAGCFSLLFSLPCLLFSIVFYGEVEQPGSAKSFPWWYFGIK